MTNYMFNLLNDDAKANAVWNGVCIGSRKDDDHNILLFQVDNFYVEVFYQREKNEITNFRSFTSTDQLELYLSKIDISDLLDTLL